MIVLVLKTIAIGHGKAINALILAIDALRIICIIGNFLADIRLRCRIGAGIIRRADGVLHRDLALGDGLATYKALVYFDTCAARHVEGDLIGLSFCRSRFAVGGFPGDCDAHRARVDGELVLIGDGVVLVVVTEDCLHSRVDVQHLLRRSRLRAIAARIGIGIAFRRNTAARID